MHRGGFALLVVLLVLIALLVLATPFLLMARNADRASTELSDRAQAHLALDAAARHARLLLGESHAGLDRTPYFDSLEEVAVDNRFDPAFLDPDDDHGLMWDLERADVAGSIDLNSAPPQVIANLTGMSTRLTRAIKADERELPLASCAGLEPAGVVWSNGELIRYTKISDGALSEPVRGVLGPANPSEWHGGPLPPSGHDAGAPVIDQRAFALALWRIATPDGELRALDSKERLRETGSFALSAALSGRNDPTAAAEEGISQDMLRRLSLYGSVHGGVRAGHVWQRGARLKSAVQGGKDGILEVDNARWLNPGSTVQITDGANTELALVQEVRRGGEIVLDRLLQNDYQPWLAIVRVLARRPVNLNTASPPVLEALFQNLQMYGRNSRITGDEAQKLAQLVLESRPFEGFEDFLRRVVLPAAGLEKLPSDAPVVPPILAGGTGFIDPDDALALYANGLNANDGGLLTSTMPFCFVTRDTYDLELRATVDAPSGVERFSIVREETDLVVPQRELLALWARQEDFDEALRLDLEAPWWMTGPSATSRFDGRAVPPSRVWAHMGTAEGQPYLPGVTDMKDFKDRESPPSVEHVFASRGEAGWIQLWPSRLYETSKRIQGRAIHFDHETRDPEGRYLPDQIVARATDDPQVGWTSPKALLCRPLALSMWVKPRAIADAALLDVGGTSHDTDRVSLRLEGPDLVLRVIAAGGDHPETPEKEYGEARFAIAKGTGPGLPLDVWSHVEVDVRGTRPDQIHMLVDGLAHGVRTPGMTRLAAAVSQNAAVLPVESIEGFPKSCTVRVGNELIEVSVDNGQLRAARQETGPLAGFGGRIAREEYGSLSYPGSTNVDLPQNLNSIATNHPAGATVELYGYSLPLLTDVPTGQSELKAALGPFRVAELVGAIGGSTPTGDDIQVGILDCGIGIEGKTSRVTALRLKSADNPALAVSEYMNAFHPGGGYAAIVQYDWSVQDQHGNPQPPQTVTGASLGGIEIIRYSGVNDDQLLIARRGVSASELPDLGTVSESQRSLFSAEPRAFVSQWDSNFTYTENQQQGFVQPNLRFRAYVVPISLAVPDSTAVNGFLAGHAGDSRFAQITHVADAEKTEWVRYDTFQTSQAQLVRDDPKALWTIYDTVTLGLGRSPFTRNNGGGGGGGPQQPPDGGMPFMEASAKAPDPAPTPVVPAQNYSSQWDPRLGKPENPRASFPLTEAVASRFQFRGVLGTFSHSHPVGTLVLPVFATADAGVDGGRPGRMDAAFLLSGCPDHVGWPVRVHRAHIASLAIGLTGWKQTQYPGLPLPDPDAAPSGRMAQEPFLLNRIFVALQARSPEILSPGPCGSPGGGSPGGGSPPADTRLLARLACFPSGERPRAVSRMAVGGGFDGQKSGAVPSAVVDEIVFGDAQFGRAATGDPETLAGSSLVLAAEVAEQGMQLNVQPKSLRIARGGCALVQEVLADTPEDAGLLRIGEEILCYDQRTPATGEIAVAPGGRGLLGTRPQPHHVTEPVLFLEHHPVTFLAAGVGAGDASLTVASVEDFPFEGTVLIGSELVHYTHIQGSTLEMPRASSVPGRMDHKGDGLFRGRFGTTPAGHATGEPVILFPFRYWDRWQSRADAPELSYFTLSVAQPSAYWSSCFFTAEDVEGSQVGVLERNDPEVPWDADPESDKRLRLHWKGDVEGQAIPIGHQSDRIDWRVFVKYAPGAFDLKSGLAHGWTQTPRLKRFGAFYFGPGMVLSSLER